MVFLIVKRIYKYIYINIYGYKYMEFKKWPSTKLKNTGMMYLFFFFLVFSLLFFWSWLKSKDRISLTYCYTSMSCESVSVSLHRIQNGQRGRSLHADFSPPLLPFENLSTQPRIIVQPSVVPTTLRGFTKWNTNSPAVCVCVCVCARCGEWTGETGNSFFYNWPDLGGRFLRDSPDAKSPLATVSSGHQIIFVFVTNDIFPHTVCAHSLTCA